MKLVNYLNGKKRDSLEDEDFIKSKDPNSKTYWFKLFLQSLKLLKYPSSERIISIIAIENHDITLERS